MAPPRPARTSFGCGDRIGVGALVVSGVWSFVDESFGGVDRKRLAANSRLRPCFVSWLSRSVTWTAVCR